MKNYKMSQNQYENFEFSLKINTKKIENVSKSIRLYYIILILQIEKVKRKQIFLRAKEKREKL